MYVKETVKKTFESVTGIGKRSPEDVRALIHHRKPQTILFRDDGATPNNPKLPFIRYRSPVRLKDSHDPAAIFEELFHLHGWGKSWRNGIYDYLHYHSRTHEVLGIARGEARVRFGGDKGRIVEVHAGDVAILPAGTGHQRLSASPDLLVVGAYPPEGSYDECRGSEAEHARAVQSIAQVPIPAEDPVYGRDAGLNKLWRS
jgi:uncharacterized protein YjlB